MDNGHNDNNDDSNKHDQQPSATSIIAAPFEHNEVNVIDRAA